MSENSQHDNSSNSHNPSWISVLLSNLSKPQFLIGGVIPAAIMIVLSQYDLVLEGALISSLFAFAVLIAEYILKKRYNFITALAAMFAGIQFLVALVTRNVEWYLITTVFEDLLFALIAFGSLMFQRPLIQVIVESVALDKFPEKFRKTDEYRKAWVMLTILVGIKNILDVIVKGAVLNFAPMEAYLAFRPVYNNISGAFMIFMYFWYPGYYWGKKKVKF